MFLGDEEEDDKRYYEMLVQALAFHYKHPEIWQWFVYFTFEKINQGYKHYSITGVSERIRWEIGDIKTGHNEFKLNNNHRAFYSRWFMDTFPEYEGFFKLRRQTSRDRPGTHMPPLGPSDFPEEKRNSK